MEHLDRILGDAWAFFLLSGLVAFTLGCIVGGIKGDGGKALLRGLEAAILAVVGGLLARAFLHLLLTLAGDSTNARLVVGWGFLLWPGAVDTVSRLIGEGHQTAPEHLLWLATGAGAFTGMMDGIWRIHRWNGAGWIAFPLDVTWGLAGSFNGCLFHLINCFWAGHPDEPRTGAHRYKSGFRFKGGFAVTQGSVMSNMGGHGPGSDLFRHEGTHVWQNRLFGPLFTLTYLGWMALMFVPGLIAGLVVGAGPGQGIEKYCYFDNPWEAWAYRVGSGPRSAFAHTMPQRRLIWPDWIVLVWSFLFFTPVLYGTWAVAERVW